jgi:hypothetical protein
MRENEERSVLFVRTLGFLLLEYNYEWYMLFPELKTFP